MSTGKGINVVNTEIYICHHFRIPNSRLFPSGTCEQRPLFNGEWIRLCSLILLFTQKSFIFCRYFRMESIPCGEPHILFSASHSRSLACSRAARLTFRTSALDSHRTFAVVVAESSIMKMKSNKIQKEKNMTYGCRCTVKVYKKYLAFCKDTRVKILNSPLI